MISERRSELKCHKAWSPNRRVFSSRLNKVYGWQHVRTFKSI